jgi:hypothetical protein
MKRLDYNVPLCHTMSPLPHHNKPVKILWLSVVFSVLNYNATVFLYTVKFQNL